MELRESADGLRWAIGRTGAMAVMWVQIAKTASRAAGRTEPDVHLIKQVEQVTTSALEGPSWRFARISSMGHGRGRNPCISNLAITALTVIGLQNSQEAEGDAWQCCRPNNLTIAAIAGAWLIRADRFRLSALGETLACNGFI